MVVRQPPAEYFDSLLPNLASLLVAVDVLAEGGTGGPKRFLIEPESDAFGILKALMTVSFSFDSLLGAFPSSVDALREGFLFCPFSLTRRRGMSSMMLDEVTVAEGFLVTFLSTTSATIFVSGLLSVMLDEVTVKEDSLVTFLFTTFATTSVLGLSCGFISAVVKSLSPM